MPIEGLAILSITGSLVFFEKYLHILLYYYVISSILIQLY